MKMYAILISYVIIVIDLFVGSCNHRRSTSSRRNFMSKLYPVQR